MLIKIIDWETESSQAREIRHEVFIVEQKVPENEEWDPADNEAIHFLGLADNNTPIAYARLLANGQIGRVAVKKFARQQGCGAELMKHIISHARQNNITSLFLHAQVQTIDFYRKLGFIPYGDTFMDAGILHQAMRNT